MNCAKRIGVDLEIVWNMICNDLPMLLDTVRRLLAQHRRN